MREHAGAAGSFPRHVPRAEYAPPANILIAAPRRARVAATPTHYDLSFAPDLDRARFEGTASVRLDCTGSTRSFDLHCAELEIGSCSIESGGSDVPCTWSLDPASEALRIRTRRQVSGEAVARIEFSGALNSRMLGFYLSTYSDGGEERRMATTQFEAADARRAFPCADEPAAKATFDITIRAPAGYEAVSNMPVASRRAEDGATTYVFHRTPPMSTYLVYLGVGEFERVSKKSAGTQISVLAPRGTDKSRMRFALDAGSRLLGLYGKYFGIPYPLPKLDLIAVPDFAAGAMENWGAITFREQLLLYDRGSSSARTMQLVAEVISHEIAHQWFGNLVTMKWWNDLWLNESFATFMATKFLDMLHPEWDLWGQFAGDAMANAMDLDSLSSTHPIDVEVESPSQIREIFDAISYDKGGCVLRMLEDHVGEPAFRRGLQRYLANHMYSNATGGDLWAEIGAASKSDVPSLVSSWLCQPGFPAVTAAARGGRIRLSQRRHTASGREGRGMWRIPVSLASGRKGTRVLLEKASGTAAAPGASWTANAGRTGFYRVEYPDAARVARLVAGQKIPAVDRWAVQDDLFAFWMSGRAPLSAYLELAGSYAGDPGHLPASGVARNLGAAWRLLRGRRGGEEAAAAALSHARSQMARIGWAPRRSEPHGDALLRPYLATELGMLGDEEAASWAAGMYESLLGSRPVHPDVAGAACAVAAWGGGARTLAGLKSMHGRAGAAEEKARYLGAMCCFADGRLVTRSLAYLLGRHVRPQDVHLAVSRAASNPAASDVLWPWVRSSWEKISAKLGRGNPLLSRIVSSLAAPPGGPSAAELLSFFAENPAPGTERALEQAAERIRIRRKVASRGLG